MGFSTAASICKYAIWQLGAISHSTSRGHQFWECCQSLCPTLGEMQERDTAQQGPVWCPGFPLGQLSSFALRVQHLFLQAKIPIFLVPEALNARAVPPPPFFSL